MIAEGVEHCIGDLIQEETVPHLVLAGCVDLSHQGFVAFDAVSDAGSAALRLMY